MLVLSRKTDELIKIGDHILLRVLGVKGSVVRLGIEAPSDIPILRGELLAFDPAIHPEPSPGVAQPRMPRDVGTVRIKRVGAA